MFLFSEVWKKRLEISQVTTKRKNELYFEICFKQVNSEWMDGEALLPWKWWLLLGKSKPRMKSLQIEIQKTTISVKITAKLIRSFEQTYDEIDTKIFGDPFSLLSLKNSRFCRSFQSFLCYLFGRQFSSKKTPSGHGEATKNPGWFGWFQNELVSTGVIKLPILGGIKQYKSIEILRISLLTMHWVGLENQPGFLSCKWKMTYLETALIFPVPIFYWNMIVGGRVISTSFFCVTKYRGLLDYLFAGIKPCKYH